MRTFAKGVRSLWPRVAIASVVGVLRSCRNRFRSRRFLCVRLVSSHRMLAFMASQNSCLGWWAHQHRRNSSQRVQVIVYIVYAFRAQIPTKYLLKLVYLDPLGLRIDSQSYLSEVLQRIKWLTLFLSQCTSGAGGQTVLCRPLQTVRALEASLGLYKGFFYKGFGRVSNGVSEQSFCPGSGLRKDFFGPLLLASNKCSCAARRARPRRASV